MRNERLHRSANLLPMTPHAPKILPQTFTQVSQVRPGVQYPFSLSLIFFLGLMKEFVVTPQALKIAGCCFAQLYGKTHPPRGWKPAFSSSTCGLWRQLWWTPASTSAITNRSGIKSVELPTIWLIISVKKSPSTNRTQIVKAEELHQKTPKMFTKNFHQKSS